MKRHFPKLLTGLLCMLLAGCLLTACGSKEPEADASTSVPYGDREYKDLPEDEDGVDMDILTNELDSENPD